MERGSVRSVGRVFDVFIWSGEEFGREYVGVYVGDGGMRLNFLEGSMADIRWDDIDKVTYMAR